MMVAIPELDGATGPMVFGGRSDARRSCRDRARDMQSHPERAAMLAARVDKARSRCAHVGARGAQGRDRAVQLPAQRAATPAPRRILVGVRIAAQHAARDAAPAATTSRCRRPSTTLRERDHRRQRRPLSARRPTCTRASRRRPRAARAASSREIEAQWGPAPGRQQSDGARIFVLGERFGNVLRRHPAGLRLRRRPDAAAVREGLRADARVLAPSTATCARTSARDAVLHFGTHGALEFMPGKQAGMSARVLARPPDRRPAERLPLCVEQSVGRHDRQAPRGGDARSAT